MEGRAAPAGKHHVCHFELYYDWILAALSPAARKAFAMLPEGYQFQNKSLRRSFKKGRAEGRAEAQAKDVIAVLEARKIALTREQRERILGTTELAMLDAWIRRAATVASADDLFSERPRRPARRRRSPR